MTAHPSFAELLTQSAVRFQGSVPLPLLRDVQTYRPCIWNLPDRPAHHTYWLGLFATHFPKLLEEAAREMAQRGLSDTSIAAGCEHARQRFLALLDELRDWTAPLSILDICLVREGVLRDVDIEDPYRLVKHRENQQALEHLQSRLAQLDGIAAPQARWEEGWRGVFAGNIFDLGATETAALFDGGKSVDYHDVCARLSPRPWLIDDLTPLLARHQRGAHERALLFVDNAGCDVVLGMLPLTHLLLSQGTQVILTANRTPTLNDVTDVELADLVEQAARVDPVLAQGWRDGTLTIVHSGNGVPLIDLARISPELAQAVTQQPVDLCVLEGMGRGVESNLDALLTCDVVNAAMIKDRGVAEALGGKVYDLVLRFDPAPGA